MTLADAPLSRATNRRAREREERLERIRAAGARVFARHGYDRATMEQVAEEAELGKATLYYYFETKQQLFAALVERGSERMREGLEQSLPEGEDPLRIAEALCRSSVRWFQQNPELAALLLPLMAGGQEQLGARLGAQLAGRIAAAHDPFVRHLGPLMQRLPQGEVFSDLLASLLLGIASKVQAGGAARADAELALFFELVRSAGAPEPRRRERKRPCG